MQEEFSRYQGYWWQPCATDVGVYRLVFELVDESEVDICCFPSAGSAEEFRFPRAGTPNARSELKIAQFKLNNTLQISDVKLLGLNKNLQCIFPFVEYIVRVGWTPEGHQ
jgi:dipeptidyl-peptidase 9